MLEYVFVLCVWGCKELNCLLLVFCSYGLISAWPPPSNPSLVGGSVHVQRKDIRYTFESVVGVVGSVVDCDQLCCRDRLRCSCRVLIVIV